MALQFNWSDAEKKSAKDFFGTNPSGDQVYQRAKDLGLNSLQLTDLYSQSTGANFDDTYSKVANYDAQNGGQLTGSYVPGSGGYTEQTSVGAASGQAKIPKANGQYNWSDSQLGAARDFFNTNPSGEQIYQHAQKYGLNQNQLADIYSLSTGRDFTEANNNITSWLQQNNKNMSGWYRPNSAADPYQTQYRPNEGMIFNPSNNVASARTEDWTVTPQQTVQGQLQGLLSQNNPLVQMAQTQGLENAQQRGLLNSSLGAEAGALAHYQYAMPIAQADAQTYSAAARTNAENRTQMNQTNAGFENQYNLANFNAQNQLKQMEAQQKLNLSTMNAQQAQQVRTNYVSQMNAIQQSMNNFINSVQASNDITPEAKSELIANYQNVQFPNMINMTNAVYSNLPEWQKEWSLLPPTIG